MLGNGIALSVKNQTQAISTRVGIVVPHMFRPPDKGRHTAAFAGSRLATTWLACAASVSWPAWGCATTKPWGLRRTPRNQKEVSYD